MRALLTGDRTDGRPVRRMTARMDALTVSARGMETASELSAEEAAVLAAMEEMDAAEATPCGSWVGDACVGVLGLQCTVDEFERLSIRDASEAEGDVRQPALDELRYTLYTGTRHR